jgi:hypothetical protein
MAGEGLRFNGGKLRYDLIHPKALKGLVEVMTAGANKYAERNWEKGMSWTTVIASLKRHLALIESGEDYDLETGRLHADHLQCNAHFLSAYYEIFPQGDDRPNTFFDKRIALDIDGVLADYATAFCDHVGMDYTNKHWLFSYTWRDRHRELYDNKDFWVNLKPLVDGASLPFEPVAYVTNRHIPVAWCEEWLEKNGFPCVPVHVVTSSKVEAIKQIGVDLFVDDCYDNFTDLNKNGVFCYLYDREYNRKFDVGHKRIYSLNDIVKR